PYTARVPRARGWGRAGGLLAAACLVAVTFVAVQNTQSDRDQLDRLSSQYGRFSDLLSTPDARLVSATGTNGATGTAVVSASRDELLFLSRDLPAPPGDRVYQLWLIDADGPHPAGLLTSPSTPLLAGGVSGAQKVALTVEPQGGSPSPTTEPVVVITLA
ncbi:anti-sigma factor, partial [Lentzea sp. PSKA42]